MVDVVEMKIEVPKEIKELEDAVVALVMHFKKGGSVADAALLLPMFMQGIAGMDKMGAEWAGKKKEIILYSVMKIAEALGL